MSRGVQRARLDGNHRAVVEALRAAGITVQSLAAVGSGCPDLLCGWRGYNVLIEVKDGSLSPSKRRFTDDEALWHPGWRGQVATVYSPAEAIDCVYGVAAGWVKRAGN